MIVVGKPFRTGWLTLEKYKKIIAAGVVYDKVNKTYAIPEEITSMIEKFDTESAANTVITELWEALGQNQIGIQCRTCGGVIDIWDYKFHFEKEKQDSQLLIGIDLHGFTSNNEAYTWRKCIQCGGQMNGMVVGWFTVRFYCPHCEVFAYREIPGKYFDFIRDEALQLLLESEDARKSEGLRSPEATGTTSA